MAIPANLTSFCLASTCDTLPSPTNLKRWRITIKAMYIPYSRDVCTTTHILGACKVSLLYRRIYSDKAVLCQVIEALKTSISNIK